MRKIDIGLVPRIPTSYLTSTFIHVHNPKLQDPKNFSDTRKGVEIFSLTLDLLVFLLIKVTTDFEGFLGNYFVDGEFITQ